MTDQPFRSELPAPARSVPDDGLDQLGVCLTGAVTALGAYGGGVYLLAPDDDVLVLSVLQGLPSQFAGPWLRTSLDAPMAVSDAVRRRELVWIGSEEDMARRYPRTALTLPYRFASAALPILAGGTVAGSMFLNWPGSHPPELARAERDGLRAAAAAMGHVVTGAAAAGRPPAPPDRPVILPGAAPDPVSGEGGDPFAVAAARLPDGLCALDADGRVTCVNPRAANLLGAPADALVGNLLWRVVPWLDHPLYRERYRSAAMSRQSTGFLAFDPPKRWLSFRLHPDTTGITVVVSEAGPAAPKDAPGAAPPGEPLRVEAIYHVLHLAAALTEAEGVDDIVRLVGDQLRPAFAADALLLLTVDEGERVHVAGSRGHSPPFLERLEQVGRVGAAAPGADEWALISGAPVFLETGDDLASVFPEYAEFAEMTASAILPLIAAGRPVGACVLSYRRSHRFTVEQRAVLTSLGGLIAQALVRALRYDTTHDLARNLQSALLPRALPAVPGLDVAARYRPASAGMQVGGDFYDLIPMGGRQVAAVIGDVQGHNATAAALMGQIRTAVRAHVAAGADPRRVLSRTNQLLNDLDPGLFASALHLHLDVGRGRVLMARAGHPHPLVRRPDGRTSVLEIPGGPLLGVDPEASYPRLRALLPPGTVLALYTDGLIETPGADPDQALAELARRLEAAPGDASLDDLAASLIDGAPGTDDAALLLLRPTAGAP